MAFGTGCGSQTSIVNLQCSTSQSIPQGCNDDRRWVDAEFFASAGRKQRTASSLATSSSSQDRSRVGASGGGCARSSSLSLGVSSISRVDSAAPQGSMPHDTSRIGNGNGRNSSGDGPNSQSEMRGDRGEGTPTSNATSESFRYIKTASRSSRDRPATNGVPIASSALGSWKDSLSTAMLSKLGYTTPPPFSRRARARMPCAIQP